MSSRHRARLLAEEERKRQTAKIKAKEATVEEESDDEEEEAVVARRGFTFMNADTSSEEDYSSEDDSETEDTAKPKASTLSSAPTTPPLSSAKEDNDMEFLEAEIARANQDAAKVGSGSAADSQGFGSILRLKDVRNLNPDNELKRKLGKLGLSAAQQHVHQETPLHQQQMMMGRRSGGASGRHRRTHKALFCTLNDGEVTPPPPAFASGGARMNLVSTSNDGISRFAFEASDTYRSAQRIFEHVQATMDPNEITAFLNQHPWHVPAYLAMSDVYLQTSQLESAETMLRTALYILEGWLHPRFPSLLEEGRCRISLTSNGSLLPSDDAADKSCGLDKMFLSALFKSMMISRRKSLFKTAFSLVLTLYSFDPEEDPFFALLVLDDLALWAGEFDFVLQLAESNEVCHALPGLLFSTALAYKALGQNSNAEMAASRALSTHPGLFIALIAEINKQGVDTKSDAMLQSALNTCKALASPVDTVTERLYTFFAHTGFRLWSSKKGLTTATGGGGGVSEPPPYLWLAFQATKLLPKEQEEGQQEELVTAEADGTSKLLEHYASVRLAHFMDDTGAINLVDDGAGVLAQQEQQLDVAAEPNVNMDTNLMNLFFQTMMPWAVLPNDEGNEEGNDGGGHETDD